MAQIVKPPRKSVAPAPATVPAETAQKKRKHHERFVFTDFAMI